MLKLRLEVRYFISEYSQLFFPLFWSNGPMYSIVILVCNIHWYYIIIILFCSKWGLAFEILPIISFASGLERKVQAMGQGIRTGSLDAPETRTAWTLLTLLYVSVRWTWVHFGWCWCTWSLQGWKLLNLETEVLCSFCRVIWTDLSKANIEVDQKCNLKLNSSIWAFSLSRCLHLCVRKFCFVSFSWK